MSDVLKDLYNACNPVVPATAEYYMDCSAVRGSNPLTRQFQGELSKTNDPLFFLFSGHIGSGKSSELEHLRHTLAHPSPIPPCRATSRSSSTRASTSTTTT